MRTCLKIFLVISFTILFCKINAQIDTLNYLKQFEVSKDRYINQPFSKLLDDMIKLQPKTLYTQIGGCNYNSQFYFTDVDKKFGGQFKINIVWENSPFYEGEIINNLNELYNLKELEYVYEKYIIKNIEFNYTGDFYVSHNATKTIKDDDVYIHLKTYLEDYKESYLINRPFFDFICWAKPMKIIKVKDMKDVNNSQLILKSTFLVINPYKRKNRVKVIVYWKTPISKKDTKVTRWSIKNNKRTIYTNGIIRDINIDK